MKQFRKLQILIGFVISMTLVGCQAGSPSPQPTMNETASLNADTYPFEGNVGPFTYPEPGAQKPLETTTPFPIPVAPADAPQPEPGMASLSGVIFSYTIGRLLPETNFYLTHGFGPEDKDIPPAFIGPLDNKGDIKARTDKNGVFSLNNIAPGNYYLVVEAPYNWSVMEMSNKNSTPKLLELQADQKYALGVVFVSWP